MKTCRKTDNKRVSKSQDKIKCKLTTRLNTGNSTNL